MTKWKPFDTLHNGLGSACVFVTIFGSLSGTVTAALMKGSNNEKPWKSKEYAQRVAQIHKVAGIIMLLLGNVAIMTGVGHYYGDRLEGDYRKILGPFNMGVFIVLVFIFEAIYRIRNKYSMGHIETPTKTKVFTPSQIEA